MYTRALFKSLVIILFLISFLQSAHADTSASGAIKVIIPHDAPPTYYIDKKTGKANGFAIEVMDKISAHAGLKVEYVFGHNWTEIIEKVSNGEADVALGIGISDERKKILDFTLPIDSFPVSFFVRAESDDMDETKNSYHVGVIKGSIANDLLRNSRQIRLMPFDSYAEGLFDLLSGRIDAFVCAAPTLIQLARDSGVEDRIRITGRALTEQKRGMAVRKDNPLLFEKLNKAIEGFVGSPEYQHIYSKWYGNPIPYWTPAKIELAAGVILIAVIAIMAGWRYYSIMSINRRLAESERKYKIVADNTYDWEFWIDPDGRFVYTSPSCMNITGYTVADFGNDSTLLNRIIHPSDQEEFGKHRHEATRETVSEEIEFRIIRPDGSVRWISHLCTPIVDETGRFLGTRGSNRDITDRKTAEEEKERVIVELQDAISKVKTLSGMLPICASCKKIRDDKGYWNQVETYIHDRTDVDFSHSICPDCAKKLYPEYYDAIWGKRETEK